jgi:hypothetical protein
LSETICFAAEMAEGTITDLLPPIWEHAKCRKAALLAAFSAVLPELKTLLESGQSVIEIR